MEATTDELRGFIEVVDRRFGVWKKQIFVLILIVTVVVVFKSFNNQHKEIRAIRDSISNFYREFDGSMMKNPAEMKQFMAKADELSKGPMTNLEDINKASKEADKKIETMQNYDNDKTGRPDLASKAAGAKIAGTGRDTKTFYSCSTFMKLMNCPTKVNGPEKAIEASTAVGECFAFKGQNGTLIIELVGPAMVDSVTIEHIPKKMSPTGDVSEAPKVFSFSGLNSENDVPHNFGKFTFLANSTSIKTFSVQKRSPIAVKYVKFDFEENNGNSEKTCVYRLRVHGVLEKN